MPQNRPLLNMPPERYDVSFDVYVLPAENATRTVTQKYRLNGGRITHHAVHMRKWASATTVAVLEMCCALRPRMRSTRSRALSASYGHALRTRYASEASPNYAGHLKGLARLTNSYCHQNRHPDRDATIPVQTVTKPRTYCNQIRTSSVSQ